MEYEEPYESWKRARAKVVVPNDFADRVMASIHDARQQTRWLLIARIAATIARSRLLRATVCSLALAVWIARIGIILTIFVPR